MAAALRTAFPTTRNSALFVCDVQERFRSVIHQYDSVIETGKKMISAANILDIPIIVTEQNPKVLGGTVNDLDISKAEIVQPKMCFSMMSPEINSILSKHKISDVIILGIESHVCVLHTTMALLAQKDLRVHVLADGISSSNRGEVPIAVKRMLSAGANLTTSESILFQMLQTADHDRFREISKLVKHHKEGNRIAVKELAERILI